MKKFFTFVSAALLACSLQAVEFDTIQVDGIYYQLNPETQTATLIRHDANSKYEIDDIVIPVSVSKDETFYPVVALGQGALRNTTAKTITFAEGSQVTELGMQAFQAAVNVQELELPEGIKLIPLTCIHNATATNPMTMKKLVLPASVDSIARLSICLPQLKVLEFKGAVPPRINTFTTGSGYTQNPWEVSTGHACNTAKTAVVLVPKGAVEAYRNTEWIGDYFDVIVDVLKDTIQVDGLYYELNNLEQTATLIRLNTNSKYEIDDIVIPVSVSKDGREFPVVALGQGALRNTTAKTITFAEGSQVTELGMQVFQGAVNVQELELPEGVKLVPMSGIHNASASNPMTMKKLVLPASVDSIARLSICLPQLETLEFKGAVPPRINTFTTGSGYTQNPWEVSTGHACNTAKSAVVIVPKGSLEAYQNTAWIGDYFTTIQEAEDTATAVENVSNNNAFRSGVYSITGCYLGEDATNLPKGMYIINGQKVIR
ncbi:MAG: leucine-rich repeat protein [Paludibacteraceae bacterium]|nr:leucine-rich repeat protein [Paludibacteraceae bacterium]